MTDFSQLQPLDDNKPEALPQAPDFNDEYLSSSQWKDIRNHPTMQDLIKSGDREAVYNHFQTYKSGARKRADEALLNSDNPIEDSAKIEFALMRAEGEVMTSAGDQSYLTEDGRGYQPDAFKDLDTWKDRGAYMAIQEDLDDVFSSVKQIREDLAFKAADKLGHDYAVTRKHLREEWDESIKNAVGSEDDDIFWSLQLYDEERFNKIISKIDESGAEDSRGTFKRLIKRHAEDYTADVDNFYDKMNTMREAGSGVNVVGGAAIVALNDDNTEAFFENLSSDKAMARAILSSSATEDEKAIGISRIKEQRRTFINALAKDLAMAEVELVGGNDFLSHMDESRKNADGKFTEEDEFQAVLDYAKQLHNDAGWLQGADKNVLEPIATGATSMAASMVNALSFGDDPEGFLGANAAISAVGSVDAARARIRKMNYGMDAQALANVSNVVGGIIPIAATQYGLGIVGGSLVGTTNVTRGALAGTKLGEGAAKVGGAIRGSKAATFAGNLIKSNAAARYAYNGALFGASAGVTSYGSNINGMYSQLLRANPNADKGELFNQAKSMAVAPAFAEAVITGALAPLGGVESMIAKNLGAGGSKAVAEGVKSMTLREAISLSGSRRAFFNSLKSVASDPKNAKNFISVLKKGDEKLVSGFKDIAGVAAKNAKSFVKDGAYEGLEEGLAEAVGGAVGKFELVAAGIPQDTSVHAFLTDFVKGAVLGAVAGKVITGSKGVYDQVKAEYTGKSTEKVRAQVEAFNKGAKHVESLSRYDGAKDQLNAKLEKLVSSGSPNTAAAVHEAMKVKARKVSASEGSAGATAKGVSDILNQVQGATAPSASRVPGKQKLSDSITRLDHPIYGVGDYAKSKSFGNASYAKRGDSLESGSFKKTSLGANRMSSQKQPDGTVVHRYQARYDQEGSGQSAETDRALVVVTDGNNDIITSRYEDMNDLDKLNSLPPTFTKQTASEVQTESLSTTKQANRERFRSVKKARITSDAAYSQLSQEGRRVHREITKVIQSSRPDRNTGQLSDSAITLSAAKNTLSNIRDNMLPKLDVTSAEVLDVALESAEARVDAAYDADTYLNDGVASIAKESLDSINKKEDSDQSSDEDKESKDLSDLDSNEDVDEISDNPDSQQTKEAPTQEEVKKTDDYQPAYQEGEVVDQGDGNDKFVVSEVIYNDDGTFSYNFRKANKSHSEALKVESSLGQQVHSLSEKIKNKAISPDERAKSNEDLSDKIKSLLPVSPDKHPRNPIDVTISAIDEASGKLKPTKIETIPEENGILRTVININPESLGSAMAAEKVNEQLIAKQVMEEIHHAATVRYFMDKNGDYHSALSELRDLGASIRENGSIKDLEDAYPTYADSSSPEQVDMVAAVEWLNLMHNRLISGESAADLQNHIDSPQKRNMWKRWVDAILRVFRTQKAISGNPEYDSLIKGIEDQIKEFGNAPSEFAISSKFSAQAKKVRADAIRQSFESRPEISPQAAAVSARTLTGDFTSEVSIGILDKAQKFLNIGGAKGVGVIWTDQNNRIHLRTQPGTFPQNDTEAHQMRHLNDAPPLESEILDAIDQLNSENALQEAIDFNSRLEGMSEEERSQVPSQEIEDASNLVSGIRSLENPPYIKFDSDPQEALVSSSKIKELEDLGLNMEYRKYSKMPAGYQWAIRTTMVGLGEIGLMANANTNVTVSPNRRAVREATGVVDNPALMNQIEAKNPDLANQIRSFVNRYNPYIQSDDQVIPRRNFDPVNTHSVIGLMDYYNTSTGKFQIPSIVREVAGNETSKKKSFDPSQLSQAASLRNDLLYTFANYGAVATYNQFQKGKISRQDWSRATSILGGDKKSISSSLGLKTYDMQEVGFLNVPKNSKAVLSKLSGKSAKVRAWGESLIKAGEQLAESLPNHPIATLLKEESPNSFRSLVNATRDDASMGRLIHRASDLASISLHFEKASRTIWNNDLLSSGRGENSSSLFDLSLLDHFDNGSRKGETAAGFRYYAASSTSDLLQRMGLLPEFDEEATSAFVTAVESLTDEATGTDVTSERIQELQSELAEIRESGSPIAQSRVDDLQAQLEEEFRAERPKAVRQSAAVKSSAGRNLGDQRVSERESSIAASIRSNGLLWSKKKDRNAVKARTILAMQVFDGDTTKVRQFFAKYKSPEIAEANLANLAYEKVNEENTKGNATARIAAQVLLAASTNKIIPSGDVTISKDSISELVDEMKGEFKILSKADLFKDITATKLEIKELSLKIEEEFDEDLDVSPEVAASNQDIRDQIQVKESKIKALQRQITASSDRDDVLGLGLSRLSDNEFRSLLEGISKMRSGISFTTLGDAGFLSQISAMGVEGVSNPVIKAFTDLYPNIPVVSFDGKHLSRQDIGWRSSGLMVNESGVPTAIVLDLSNEEMGYKAIAKDITLTQVRSQLSEQKKDTNGFKLISSLKSALADSMTKMMNQKKMSVHLSQLNSKIDRSLKGDGQLSAYLDQSTINDDQALQILNSMDKFLAKSGFNSFESMPESELLFNMLTNPQFNAILDTVPVTTLSSILSENGYHKVAANKVAELVTSVSQFLNHSQESELNLDYDSDQQEADHNRSDFGGVDEDAQALKMELIANIIYGTTRNSTSDSEGSIQDLYMKQVAQAIRSEMDSDVNHIVGSDVHPTVRPMMPVSLSDYIQTSTKSPYVDIPARLKSELSSRKAFSIIQRYEGRKGNKLVRALLEDARGSLNPLEVYQFIADHDTLSDRDLFEGRQAANLVDKSVETRRALLEKLSSNLESLEKSRSKAYAAKDKFSEVFAKQEDQIHVEGLGLMFEDLPDSSTLVPSQSRLPEGITIRQMSVGAQLSKPLKEITNAMDVGFDKMFDSLERGDVKTSILNAPRLSGLRSSQSFDQSLIQSMERASLIADEVLPLLKDSPLKDHISLLKNTADQLVKQLSQPSVNSDFLNAVAREYANVNADWEASLSYHYAHDNMADANGLVYTQDSVVPKVSEIADGRENRNELVRRRDRIDTDIKMLDKSINDLQDQQVEMSESLDGDAIINEKVKAFREAASSSWLRDKTSHGRDNAGGDGGKRVRYSDILPEGITWQEFQNSIDSVYDGDLDAITKDIDGFTNQFLEKSDEIPVGFIAQAPISITNPTHLSGKVTISQAINQVTDEMVGEPSLTSIIPGYSLEADANAEVAAQQIKKALYLNNDNYKIIAGDARSDKPESVGAKAAKSQIDTMIADMTTILVHPEVSGDMKRAAAAGLKFFSYGDVHNGLKYWTTAIGYSLTSGFVSKVEAGVADAIDPKLNSENFSNLDSRVKRAFPKSIVSQNFMTQVMSILDHGLDGQSGRNNSVRMAEVYQDMLSKNGDKLTEVENYEATITAGLLNYTMEPNESGDPLSGPEQMRRNLEIYKRSVKNMENPNNVLGLNERLRYKKTSKAQAEVAKRVISQTEKMIDSIDPNLGTAEWFGEMENAMFATLNEDQTGFIQDAREVFSRLKSSVALSVEMKGNEIGSFENYVPLVSYSSSNPSSDQYQLNLERSPDGPYARTRFEQGGETAINLDGRSTFMGSMNMMVYNLNTRASYSMFSSLFGAVDPDVELEWEDGSHRTPIMEHLAESNGVDEGTIQQIQKANRFLSTAAATLYKNDNPNVNPDSMLITASNVLSDLGYKQALLSVWQPVKQTAPVMASYALRNAIFSPKKTFYFFNNILEYMRDSSYRKDVKDVIEEVAPHIARRALDGNDAFKSRMNAKFRKGTALEKVFYLPKQMINGALAAGDYLGSKLMGSPDQILMIAMMDAEYESKTGRSLVFESRESYNYSALAHAQAVAEGSLAQSDASKKGAWLQRQETVGLELVRRSFLSFSNHVVSTAGTARSGWSMIKHGKDRQTKLQGLSLVSDFIAQNAIFNTINAAVISYLYASFHYDPEDDQKKHKKKQAELLKQFASVPFFKEKEKKPISSDDFFYRYWTKTAINSSAAVAGPWLSIPTINDIFLGSTNSSFESFTGKRAPSGDQFLFSEAKDNLRFLGASGVPIQNGISYIHGYAAAQRDYDLGSEDAALLMSQLLATREQRAYYQDLINKRNKTPIFKNQTKGKIELFKALPKWDSEDLTGDTDD